MIIKMTKDNPQVLAALEDLGCRVRVLTSFPAGTELLWGGEGRPE